MSILEDVGRMQGEAMATVIDAKLEHIFHNLDPKVDLRRITACAFCAATQSAKAEKSQRTWWGKLRTIIRREYNYGRT